MTLILDGTEESVGASLLLIESFGNISGLRLNHQKTGPCRYVLQETAT